MRKDKYQEKGQKSRIKIKHKYVIINNLEINDFS